MNARDYIPFEEMMKHLLGEIERKIDAAEITCKEEVRGNCTNTARGFHRPGYLHPCMVTDLRIILNREGWAARTGSISTDIQRAGISGDW